MKKITIAIVVFIAWGILFIMFSRPDRCGRDNCVVKKWGVLQLEQWRPGFGAEYSIYDAEHSYAVVADVKKYRVVGAYLYAVANINSEKPDLIMDNEAFYSLRANDDILTFKTPQEIPHFVKIDSLSGQVWWYKTVQEVDDADQSIFTQMQTSQ